MKILFHFTKKISSYLPTLISTWSHEKKSSSRIVREGMNRGSAHCCARFLRCFQNAHPREWKAVALKELPRRVFQDILQLRENKKNKNAPSRFSGRARDRKARNARGKKSASFSADNARAGENGQFRRADAVTKGPGEILVRINAAGRQ